ncbi:type I secretion system permease/ATPase [Shewanella fidelis]|uniref:Type I secretion system permease/ATPase n=1 Tax=Shewanella fidelis TaxID=173509 RepID=A0AAW8NRQ7_9GAMM|nr:type I secretion system permease/ATPase [Shewanella fidelis]MDR8525812.1 type I secretion system permease/ATPase [Shewanella fidelis]MDW4812679.1 type I secretion system permease/ATPase [Shewanella fidelis]MDW4816427.1 type I secretion system permease/ATPase [Shewanella fidelis]MDW4820409.1 type I secretion system permease/ATPase [Shewanella fidelis]MDW4825143.1 type I secretion system permease/ATPase [Shewanella fidelis]
MIDNKTDLLANVITALCQRLGLECSEQMLFSRLLIKPSGLSSSELVQACNNVGIEAVEQKLPLTKMALPAIVFSKLDVPALLDKNAAGEWLLLSGDGQQTVISSAEFKANYHQDSWHVKRKLVTDARSEEHHFSAKRHWLLSAFDEVKPFYGSFLLGSLAINILALVTPLFTMNVYDRVVPNQAIDTLWVLATGASLAIVFDWLLKQARTRLADVAGKQVDIKMSNILFAKVLGMRLENRPASAGAFAKQLQEFDSIRDFITSATLVTAVDLPFTLLFLALIAWLGGYMVLVPLACMLLLLVISFVMQKKLMATIEQTSQLSTQRQAHLIETLNLLVETKQNNGEAKAQRIWDDTVSSLADWQNESRIASNTLSHSVMNSQQLVTIGLIITGVYQIHAGNLSMGGLIAIVMLSGRAGNAINQISMLLLKFKQTQSAMTAVSSILELPQEQYFASQPSTAVGFNGAVSLRDASFSYPDQPLPAFTEVDLEIKPGEKIGLLGAAGAGKSSLLSILAGQYQLSSGQLFYNRLEARQWSVSDIREHVGWMSQQPTLVYGTVLDNLLFGLKGVDENLLANTIISSGIDKLMDRLGSGLDSQVGEFGRQLSGGQRQAIALARVLLRQPKLLLLDEPTSAMDERSENQIIACLSQVETSMVIASHNPKLLSLCDRILVLDKGRITMEQTPAEMTQRGKSRIKAVNVRQKGDAK